MSGIELALWDIAGKRHGVPVHELLLGGRCRVSLSCDIEIDEAALARFRAPGRPARALRTRATKRFSGRRVHFLA